MAEGDDTGLAAILKAIARNPTSALNLVGILFGGMTIYFTLHNDIAESKASTLRAEAEQVVLRDSINTNAIKSDTHYAELAKVNADIATELAKQNGAVNSALARIETNMQWLMQRPVKPVRP